MPLRALCLCVLAAAAPALLAAPSAHAGRRRPLVQHEPIGSQLWASPQANPIALSPDGTLLAVAATTSNRVDFFHTADMSSAGTVEVGMEPVAVAFHPSGNEVWVSNHVSDSVSVIDLTGPTKVVAETIQDLDGSGVSQFDEPVGIAFASASKAYVALSSRNDVAVVDADPLSPTAYQVLSRIHITAQDPRALTVRGGYLYVTAFESGNQSELSLCPDSPNNPPQCTLDATDVQDFVIASPNIPGADTRIVRDPDVPDRDVFVIDTSNDEVVGVIEGVGTLLYGVAVDSAGRVFVSQTEARNDVNGENGQNLVVLANRLFLNQVAEIDCSGGACDCTGGPPVVNPVCAIAPTIHELEPLPPSQPSAGEQLATPYGIALTSDDATLVVTAAASSRVFTLDAATGNVLSRQDVGAIPRGLALRDNGNGTHTAYVLNTLDNTVSVLTVTDATGALASAGPDVAVGADPTPAAVRLGRIAFNDAEASSTGTFACASCHPDGMADQLLWRIGGACFFGACSGDDEIRSTMPVRGLKNTLPLHWDGTLGDPFGGSDGSVSNSGSNPADCSLGGPDGDADCFRHLVDESQQGVMCDQSGGCDVGPSGLDGPLDNTERDHMAAFLASVSYPPARSRRIDDSVSTAAVRGFSDFFVDKPTGGFAADLGDLLGVVTCADMDSGCHALPLGVDDNSVTLAGFDVPTMRGMTDRFLQFSIGITNPQEAMDDAASGDLCFDIGLGPICLTSELPWDPEQGLEEDEVFATAFPIFDPVYDVGPIDMFQMFEEASTGYSGATGRQVTLNADTTAGCSATCGGGVSCAAEELLEVLQAADARGAVNLRGTGLEGGAFRTLEYLEGSDQYAFGNVNGRQAGNYDCPTLIAKAQAGDVYTLTGHLRESVATGARQPLLSLTTNAAGPTGNPDLPVLPGDDPMTLLGIDVEGTAQVLVDGEVVSATLSCAGGSFTPFCDSQTVVIDLAAIPSPNGLHLLQVRNPAGLESNELPVCVGNVSGCD